METLYTLDSKEQMVLEPIVLKQDFSVTKKLNKINIKQPSTHYNAPVHLNKVVATNKRDQQPQKYQVNMFPKIKN